MLEAPREGPELPYRQGSRERPGHQHGEPPGEGWRWGRVVESQSPCRVVYGSGWGIARVVDGPEALPVVVSDAPGHGGLEWPVGVYNGKDGSESSYGSIGSLTL